MFVVENWDISLMAWQFARFRGFTVFVVVGPTGGMPIIVGKEGP